MELPDCPPGAEGYQDVVVDEVPKKPDMGDCTKQAKGRMQQAELEFQEHLKSLKIRLEDDSTRCMVEKRGRDVSGKFIYLCYPCAAVCSGEAILQTHISGKKHKNKLAMRSVWPMSIFEEHPYIVSEKGGKKSDNAGDTDKILKKMAEEVDLHKMDPSDLDCQYQKYRAPRCHLQDSLDALKAALVGVEYLVEHPPEEEHHEPSYMCVLCSKQGHPRTIVNHMTCFWHRYNYLSRHFPKATALLAPYRSQSKYREGVSVIMNRLAQRIEDKFGRLRPCHIDKEEYDKDKERIHQWIYKGRHFTEQDGHTFEEVVDVDLIDSLHRSNQETKTKTNNLSKDPSPPVVPAPKAKFNNYTRSAGRQERTRRGGSVEVLSDISDEPDPKRGAVRDRERDRDWGRGRKTDRGRGQGRGRGYAGARPRYEPYGERRHDSPPSFRTKYAIKNAPAEDKTRAPNYEYKVKLAEERTKAAEESANKTLAYHEKNPEKHPLYPEEWKKFWNRRYKEIQAEGKDPSKHDFKPEWIEFWTARMKELHEEELRGIVIEIYRKLCMTPPPQHSKQERERSGRKSPVWSASVGRRHSPERRRASPPPERRRASPPPERRRPSPRPRRPEPRRPEPDRRRERRSRSGSPRRSPLRRPSPPRRPRSRSPAPLHRSRSPVRSHGTHITLESVRRSRSPLSRRDHQLRNHSPTAARGNSAARNSGGKPAPSLQTVMISDDELKPDDHLSPWNSDNDLDSLGSLPDARSPPRSHRSTSILSHGTARSRGSLAPYGPRPPHYLPPRPAEPQDLGPPENVVATLRLLVALEDYLGSVGPKVVDLMTTAIRMEKEKANSSEDLLEVESALVLIETAKEKLKGAAQAGLVAPAAENAVRAAVVRAAATLHAADTRAKKKRQSGMKPVPAVLAASAAPGPGAVDRAAIAQQMAAALVAQGKTDVSSDELAQLVDAVVGMAEAKKRETEVKKKVEARAQSEKQARPAAGTTSALQMLQSAYDENDKKAPPEKADVPDAMDGLSDSDLETLLKNFNELSAEEQHSLIAYLKKLEAKEPRRVEKLRQYVSAAAATATKPEEPEIVEVKNIVEDAPVATEEVQPVTIESDDDDYTVEEVFMSATQKVKENQIRQEMEIVKKSLEESKAAPPEKPKPSIDLLKHMSSATDLFALVQASLSTIQANSNASTNSITSAVTNFQPRSFGDMPPRDDKRDGARCPDDQQYRPPVAPIPVANNAPPTQAPYDQGFRPQRNRMYDDDNDMQNNRYNDDPSYDQSNKRMNEVIDMIIDDATNDDDCVIDDGMNADQMNDEGGPGLSIGNTGPMNRMGMDRPEGRGYNNFSSQQYDDNNFRNGNVQDNFGSRGGPRGNYGDNQFGGNMGNLRQDSLRPLMGNFGGGNLEPRGLGPRGNFGRNLDVGPLGNFGRKLDQGPMGSNLDLGPPGRNLDLGPPGRNLDLGPTGRNLDLGPPGRNLDLGPPGRNLDLGPPGRNLDQRPPVWNRDVVPPGRNFDRGPLGNIGRNQGGPQGNFGGPQGNFGGNRGGGQGFGGNQQGNFRGRGGRGNFRGRGRGF